MKKNYLLAFLFFALAPLASGCDDDGDSNASLRDADASEPDTATASDAGASETSVDVINKPGDAPDDAGSLQPPSLVVLTFPIGFLDESFRLPDVGPGAEVSLADTGGTLSPTLEPLSEVRDQLIAIADLGYYLQQDYGTYDTTILLTGHPAGPLPPRRQPPQALGPSIDWLVGRHLRGMGSRTGSDVVVIGERSYTFDGDGKNIRPVSSLAEVTTEIGRAGSSCEFAVAPRSLSDLSLGAWMDRVIPVLVAALPCEGPRVFSLNLPLPSWEELGLGFYGNLYEDAAHRIDLPGAEGRAARAIIEKYNVFVSKQVARLTQALLMSKGRHGASLLDDTLVVWVGREGQPNHEVFPWHAVLLGGQNLGVPRGRYISLPHENDFTYTSTVKAGPPHNRLLTSIGRTFGLASDSTGARSLTTWTGDKFDLTGHLQQLDRK